MRIRRLGQAGRVVAPWARAWALAVAVLAAAALVADATAAASDPLERLGARSTEVFTQTRIDGHAVRTRALRFDEPAEAVLAALATAWRTSSPAVVRAQAGGWLIASRMTDAGFETVQLRDADGGSQGFVTLWGRREDESVPLPDWLPADVRWSRQVVSGDPSGRSITTTAVLPGDAGAARRAVLARAAAHGWQVDGADSGRLRAAAPAAARRGLAVALLRRGAEQMLLTVAARAGGDAALVAYTIEAPQ